MTTLLVLDTETCGLKPPGLPASGLVEFAYLEIDGTTLEVKREFATRINPGCPIEPGAAAIHGITDDDVKDCAPLSADMLPHQDVLVVGHNIPFDLRFLQPHFPQLTRSVCTLVLARRHFPRHAHPNLLNHKLTTMAAYLGLPEQKAHSALGDCYYALGLLKKFVEITGKDVFGLEERTATAAMHHRMPFGKHVGQPLHLVPKPYLEWFVQQEIDQDLRKTIEMQLKVR